MSIQLTLDGLSFCAGGVAGEHEPVIDAIAAKPDNGPVEVEVLVPRTMLIPREFFAPELAERLLAANGMTCLTGECAVFSDPEQETVAVMAVPAEAAHTLEERSGSLVRYTTPLLRTVTTDRPTVWIFHTQGLLYIKVYGEALRFAGVTAATTDADILYFMERLGQQFPLREHELRLTGNPADRKLLKRYFKQIVCE